MRRLALLAAAFGLASCATPARVFVSPDYHQHPIKRVAAMNLQDFPGSIGSGAVVTDVYEKYLFLAGYVLVERRQADQLLKEGALNLSGAIDPAGLKKIGRVLGVDALVLGSLTDYSYPRDQTVMTTIPLEETRPVYGNVVTTRRVGDTEIKTEDRVMTGFETRQTDQVVPVEKTLPAHVGLAIRLVDVETGEVLWSASGDSSGADMTTATEEASAKLTNAIVESLDKIQ
jgi:hypothetical protein